MITVDFKRLPTQPGDRILDIGCGSGRHSSAAYELKKVNVTGADIHFNDLKAAEERLRYHDELEAHGGGDWNLSVADIENLPFKDRAFDMIICAEVMEHVPHDFQAAKELARVLKPGRRLAVSVPRYLPERFCWKLSQDYYRVDGGHIRIYKKSRLVSLFHAAGFAYRSSHFAHSLHTPYWWLKCLVGLNGDPITPVRLYQRFLNWDIMQKPKSTARIDHLLNPLLGKSLVVYFDKK
jgi:2-polyprenyl-3-methyl-5-hydroxy-6-metoxy-1,4-benzoquinol methylase